MALEITTQPQSQQVNIGDDANFICLAESIVQYGFNDISPYTPDPTYPSISVNITSQTALTATTTQSVGWASAYSQSVTYDGGRIEYSYNLTHITNDSFFDFRGVDGGGSDRIFGVLCSSFSSELRIYLPNNTEIFTRPVDSHTFNVNYVYEDGDFTIEVKEGVEVIYSATLPFDLSSYYSLHNEVACAGATGSGLDITDFGFVVWLGLTYQWKKDAIDIPLETIGTLSLTNIQGGDFASYTCLVDDGIGTLLSDVAVLSKIVIPYVKPAARRVITTPRYRRGVPQSIAVPEQGNWEQLTRYLQSTSREINDLRDELDRVRRLANVQPLRK